jgi:hypothetical protein
MKGRWSASLRRLGAAPQVQEVSAELKQYLEERYLEKEVAANTSAQVKAFAEIVAAVDATPNAVVRLGNLLVAKHTSTSGSSQLFAQSLTAAQMRLIEENPGILASPERVLEMLAIISSTVGSGPPAIDGTPPAP